MEHKEEGSQKRKPVGGIVAAVIVVAVVFGLIALVGSNASNYAGSPVSSGSSSPCGDPNLKQDAQTVGYKELDKDPTSFIGTKARFTGQVIQIQQSDGGGIIRLAADTLFGNVWNPADAIFITYQGDTNVVEGDIVNVYGELTGTKTYTSQANWNITLPSMTGCIVEEASTTAPSTATAQPASAPAVTAPAQSKVSAPAQAPTQPAPVQPAAQMPPSAPKSWHTVTTITTATTKNTPPFTIQGTEWRATWSCQAALPVNTTPTVTAESTNGFGGGVVAEPNNCPSGDTTYFYDGPGSYYLQIYIYDPATVTVTIEDYY